MPLLSPFSMVLGRLVSKSHFPFLYAFIMTKQGCNAFKLNSLKLITLSYCTSLPQKHSEMSCLKVSEYKDHTVKRQYVFDCLCLYRCFTEKH